MRQANNELRQENPGAFAGYTALLNVFVLAFGHGDHDTWIPTTLNLILIPDCKQMDFVTELKKIPPVTRYLCLATVGVTGAAQLEMLNLYWVFYHTDFVLKKFQVCKQ